MKRLLTSERRDELLAACCESEHGDSKFGGTLLGCDELRELLETHKLLSDVKDAAYRVYVHGLGPSRYEQGIRDAAGTILYRIDLTFPISPPKVLDKDEP